MRGDQKVFRDVHTGRGLNDNRGSPRESPALEEQPVWHGAVLYAPVRSRGVVLALLEGNIDLGFVLIVQNVILPQLLSLNR